MIKPHPRRYRSRQSILGLFPTWETTGGIQASGRLAWESLVCGNGNGAQRREREAIIDQSANEASGDFYLFTYGASARSSGGQFTRVHSASNIGAVTAALGRRWPVTLVLVWHIGLLKLLPFFRAGQARVVLFLHGIEAWKPQPWLTRTLLKRVDLFLSNSEFTWQRFLRFNPDLNSAMHQIVRLGLGSSDEAPRVEPLDPPAVLTIGRLAKSENYKGHRELIEAWPLVQRQIRDAELWIAGDGDLRPELERLVDQRKLKDSVRFFGWVSEEKKQELFSKSRCLALPSRGEGFGLVYLEAMRMGRPCLVSTVDAGREVVNPPEAGLAANPNEPKELSEAVCRLLTDGAEWRFWSKHARDRYASHFTAKHFQQRLLSALSL